MNAFREGPAWLVAVVATGKITCHWIAIATKEQD
jgi:hypothetical protein